MAYPNLEAELSRAGVTHLQVAELIGKNKSTISSKMHGRNGGFNLAQAYAIRNAFFPEMSIDYLFSETPMPAEKATA